MGYLASLPLYRIGLFPVGGKTFVVSDFFFAALVLAATALRRWRGPVAGLMWVAPLPALAALAAAMATATPWDVARLEIARAAYSMLTLTVVASLPLDAEELRLAARTWVVTASAACVVGILSFAAVVVLGLPRNWLAQPNSPNLGPGVVRISGVLQTNTLTLYLTLGAAFSAFQARFASSGRGRRLGSAALALLSLTAFASASRGAIGFFVVVAMIAYRRELAPGWLHSARLATAGLAAVFLLMGAALTIWAVVPVAMKSEGSASSGSSWTARPNAYRVLHSAGVRMFAAHPVFGIGAGRFGARLGDHSTAEERSRAWPAIGEGQRVSPHSTWIGLAAEGGLTLLLAWVAVWAVAAVHLLARSAPVITLAPYIGLALLGLALNGTHIELTHLKFIWAGLGLGLNQAGAVAASAKRRCS